MSTTLMLLLMLLGVLSHSDDRIVQTPSNNRPNQPSCLYKQCEKWIITIMLDLSDTDNQNANLLKVEQFANELASECFKSDSCDSQIWVQWPTPELDDENCNDNQKRLWQLLYSNSTRLGSPMSMLKMITKNDDDPAPPWKCNCSSSCADMSDQLNASTIYRPYEACSTFPLIEMIGTNYAASMYQYLGYGVSTYYISDHYSEQLDKNAKSLQNNSDYYYVNAFWLFIGVDQFPPYAEPYSDIARAYPTPDGAVLNYRILDNFDQLTPELASVLSPCANTTLSDPISPSIAAACMSLGSTTPDTAGMSTTADWFQNDSGPYSLSVVLILASNNNGSDHILDVLKVRFSSPQNQCNENSIDVRYIRFIIPGDFDQSDTYITSDWFDVTRNATQLQKYINDYLQPNKTEVPAIGHITPYEDDNDNCTVILTEQTLYQDVVPTIKTNDASSYQHLVLLISDFVSIPLAHRSYCLQMIEAVKGDQFAVSVISDKSVGSAALETLFSAFYQDTLPRASFVHLKNLEKNPRPNCLLTDLIPIVPTTTFTTPVVTPDRNIGWLVVLACLCGFTFIVCGTALICIYNKHRQQMIDKIAWVQKESAEARKRRISTHPTTILQKVDAFEVSHDRVSVHYDRQLGSGAFGTVFQGILLDGPQESNPGYTLNLRKSSSQKSSSYGRYVAIKMLPKHACIEAKADFLREIAVLKSVHSEDCPHVAQLVGCVTVSEPLCLITEFCQNGDLLALLQKKHFTDSQPLFNINDSQEFLSPRQLLSLAWQVADGMHYIGSRGFVHRDLAARNVFVDADLTAKVGDFGLCRSADCDDEQSISSLKLAIKWMAIESLKTHDFSTMSDVWSYGVLLYEIFSMGRAVPYQDIKLNRILPHLQSGKRLDRPSYATEKVYQLMLDCWKITPTSRPSFVQIRTRLAKILERAVEEYGYLLTSNRADSILSTMSTPSNGTHRRLSVSTLQSQNGDNAHLPILADL